MLTQSVKQLESRIAELTEEVSHLREDRGKLLALEKSLRRSEERWRVFFEQAADSMVLVDSETQVILDFNELAPKSLGYTPQEFKQLSLRDIEAKESPEEVAEHIDKIRTQGFDTFETLIRHKDGSLRNYLMTVRAVKHNESFALLGIWHDDTDRRKALTAMQESEARLHQIARAIDDVVWITDWNEQKVLFINHAYEEIWGRSIKDIYEKPEDWIDGIYPDDRERISGAFANIVMSGHCDEECRVVKPDGSIKLVRFRGYPICSPDGQVRHVVGIAEDISERRRGESQLKTLSMAIEQCPATVVITDPDGLIVYVNPAFTTITGYSAEEALGRTPAILSSSGHTEEFYRTLWDTVLSGDVWHGEFCNRRKNGDLYWESAAIAPVRDAMGKTTHFVGVKEDVTLEKLRAAELKRAKNAAEVANRTKSEFLANMSHELRTPLNAIIGFSEVLLDESFGSLSDKQKRQTDHILSSGRHLLSLINDILDLSKIEAGKMELELAPVDVGALLADAMFLIKERASKQGVQLKLDVEPAINDATLQADDRKLRQVMFNLLSNAAKYTTGGQSISVTAKRVTGEDDVSLLEISVSDTGIGIAKEDQERIFGQFEQGDSSYARAQGGTGLGLALTRRLVEVQGGNISVKSEGEGKGSTFVFRIPYLPQDKQ